jgi:hypothetical protein
MLEDLREADRKNPRGGFRIGVVPTGGLEGLKGLAAFSSVLKTWSAAEEQQQDEEAAAELGLGPEGAAAAADGAGRVPVKLEPGSSGYQPAGVRVEKAGAASSAAAAAARTAAQAALASTAAPAAPASIAAAAAAAGGSGGSNMLLTGGDTAHLQLQLPLLADGIDAADADLFGGIGLSSSSEDERDNAALLGSIQPGAAAAAAAAATASASAAGDSSEEWEEVEPAAAQLLSGSQPSGQQEQQQQGEEEDRRPGWRERMALRQKFWSTSHGFRLGRKLGDWAAAEELAASQAPAGPAAAAAAAAGTDHHLVMGAAAGPAAAPGGAIAAVIGGALGRSPVKAQAGRRMGQLQGARGAGAVLGSELAGMLGSDEDDAELQAAIQLSLTEAGGKGGAAVGSSSTQRLAACTRSGAGVVEDSCDGVDGQDTVGAAADIVMVVDDPDWEGVEAPAEQPPAPAAAAIAVPQASAEATSEGALGGVAAGARQQGRQLPLQQPASTVHSSSMAASAGAGRAAQHQHQRMLPAVGSSAGPVPAAVPQQTRPCSNGGPGAVSIAALYNGRSSDLLEQLPAAAPSRQQDVAALKRDLMAGADAATMVADGREYPDLHQNQEQHQSRAQLASQDLQQPPVQQEWLQDERRTTSSWVPATADGADAAGAGAVEAAGYPTPAAGAAVDFSFLDQQPASVTVRPILKSPAAAATAAAVPAPPPAAAAAAGLRVAPRAVLKPPKPPAVPSLKVSGRQLQPQEQQELTSAPSKQQPQQQQQADVQPLQPQIHEHQVHQQRQPADKLDMQLPEQPDRWMLPAPARLPADRQTAQDTTGPAGTSRQGQQQEPSQQEQQQPAQQQQQQPVLPHQQQQQPALVGGDGPREPAALVDIDAELANLAAESTQLRSRLTTAARNTATPTQVRLKECALRDLLGVRTHHRPRHD